MGSRLISIVVPVYNEADSLEALAGEISEVGRKHNLDIEVVFVDDGSRDASWTRIAALASADPAVAGIRFRRNCGKAAALMAGFAAVRGEVVFMMDADLQDPPDEIPHLLGKLDEGNDLVSGWKQIRHDPWHKVYPSRVFNKLIGWLTGIHLHDHVCGLKCMRRDVAKDLKIYGELHRFISVLSAARGYRVTEVGTLHRARTRGVGKYGLSRFFKGFLDLLTICALTRYRWRPQHVIGTAAFLTVLLSLVVWAAGWLHWSWLSTLQRLIMVLWSGVVLIAVGLVAELLVAERPIDGLYDVAERVGWCATVEDQGE